MNYRKSVAAVCGLLLAAAVQAGEQQHTRIEIAIDDDAASEQSFVFDRQDAGFNLQSMLLGESRSVTDRSGSTADIRRTEDGFEIDVNGRTIDLPDMHGHDGAQGEHEIELMMDDTDADTVAIKKVRMIKSDSANGVTIISGSEIGPETRERIAEALRSAGQDGEVVYLDGSELHNDDHQAHGSREVRIIRKEVDVTN